MPLVQRNRSARSARAAVIGAACLAAASLGTVISNQSAAADTLMVDEVTDFPVPATVPVGAEEAFGNALAESSENPTLLSGAYIDPTTGNLTIAGVDATALATAKAHALLSVAPTALAVDTIIVSRSYADLDSITNSVYDDTEWPSTVLFGAGPDYLNNRVIITVDAVTPTVRSDLYALYGSSVVVMAGPQSSSLAMYGDTSPFYGERRSDTPTRRDRTTITVALAGSHGCLLAV